MQKVSVLEFTFNKPAQIMVAEAGDLQARGFDMDAALRYEPFQVVGQRETRTYMLYDVQREGARHEIGDITAWLFRHVDGYGRALPGPRITVLND